ncbi:MAG: hypothetical protein WBA20_05525 [Ketobacter sp.]
MKPTGSPRMNAQFTVLLLAAVRVLSCLALFSAAAWAQPSSTDQDQIWESALEKSGVNDVLAQANVLIDQEITNLGKAPLGFTRVQLEQLNQQFRRRFGSEQLKREIIEHLEQSFSQHDKQELDGILQSRQLRNLQQLQEQLQDADIRKAMRSYRLRVKELPPNSERMALLVSLDEVLQQSNLESQLKVELRKQLLAVVSRLKTNQSYSEELLDQQLVNYRQSVEGEISENALFAYLYLLKRTPTHKLEQLLTSLDQPIFDRFMAVCLKTVQKSFLEARQQISEDIRLAEH